MVTTYLANVGARIRGLPPVGADSVGQPFASHATRYDVQRAYDDNILYGNRGWLPDGSTQGIPANIRAIINPTGRVADWYAANIYPGLFTDDGLPSPDGAPCSVPFAGDTPEEIRLPIMQGLRWGGWEADIRNYPRTGALNGDVFVEIEWTYPGEDEDGMPTTGKVYPILHHPAYVKNVVWDRAGNVRVYELAIPQVDPNGIPYVWGKRVTRSAIITLKDGEAHGYDGLPAEMENPWGFVAATWVQHRNRGGQHGASAIHGLHRKLAEVNGLMAAADDFILKFVNQKVIVETTDPKQFVTMAQATPAGQPVTVPGDPGAGRETGGVLAGPPGTRVHHLIENLGLGEANAHIQRVLEEIERDIPEITLSEKLSGMSDISEPGARALLMAVNARLGEAMANYDLGLSRIVQSLLTIGGELASSGGWGPRSRLTEGQRLFLPWRLDSYAKGETRFSWAGRPLFPATVLTKAMEAAAIDAIKTPSGLRHVGLSDDDIYGEGLAPTVRPGILAEREDAAGGTADLLGRAFAAGNL